MKATSINRVCGLFALAGLAALASCGGGGETPTSGRGLGALRISVKWPARSRFVPLQSASINAVLTSGSTVLGSHLILYEDGPTSPQFATFNNLSPGTVTLTATAYPTQQGTGVPQASGAVSATIVSGQTTDVTLTMANLIDHVTITPANPVVNVGGQTTETATAYDKAGDVVITTGDFSWTAQTSGIIDPINVAAPAVNVTGVSIGSTLLTATLDQAEGGFKGSTNITVNGGALLK